MKNIQWYNCLQVPTVREQCHSASRSTLELEVTCCPPGILTSLPKSDQPRWSTHWPGSCQHQANCIQWIPYTPIWCTPWPHHLAARWLWQLIPLGNLLLVHTHPSPAILGLPSCKRLAVVKMNCAITVI